MKKLLTLILGFIISIFITSCKGGSSSQLSIYNCGEYIDDSLIDQFEEEYNIKVNYVTFDSNETAVTKLQTESFDVVIPSDYAIEQLVSQNLLSEIDWNKLESVEGFKKDMLTSDVLEILERLKNQENGFDFLKYAVPYFFGKVGILYDYNKIKLDLNELDPGWDILLDPKYRNMIAYYDSARDGFMAAYKANGFSMNSTDESETLKAFDWLKELKAKSNCAFKTDELLSEMPDGKYAMSLVYSGDAIYCIELATEADNGIDLRFYAPESDGTNVFVDGMVIPKNAKNKDLAYKFISFMCREESALANTEYVYYSSCIQKIYDKVLSYDSGTFKQCNYLYKVNINPKDEVFRYNPQQTIILNDYWIKLKLS